MTAFQQQLDAFWSERPEMNLKSIFQLAFDFNKPGEA